MDTDAELTARIAAVVREAVAASEYSTKALAESTGIARGTLMRKLKGPSESPFNTAELARLAAVLGIPVSEIVSRAEHTKGGQAA
jgi:transcriptional regulator with XRE-family HTH domain